MKISLNWLNDYIDIDRYKVEDLADIFTSLGIEVETIEKVSPITGDVVVGKILEAKPHPNADSLQVCTVEVGAPEPLSIVCGAANARKDLTVAAALKGAVLPGDFKIKNSKIRGEASYGMLCGETELGVGNDDSGIMELDSSLKPGTSISQHFKLEDTVFELGLTPNRADCLGYLGLARDLSAKLGLPLKTPEIYQNAHKSDYKTTDVVSVEIQEEESCGRFCALAVKNVRTIASPAWVQRRLEMSGMRAVNLIVDATNYVMLEYGQPIHAYDKRDLSGSKIIVRDAKENESIVTLDDQKRSLSTDDIVICDEKGPVGVAGVMGGENSEVKEDTSEIVIEVASFHPIKVRKTSKRLGIHSEASHRFERGTDIEACDVVCHRVSGMIASLIKEETGSEEVIVSSELIDTYPKKAQPSRIALRLERLHQISGDSSYDNKSVEESLSGLGIRLLDQKDGRLLFEVPTWRHDIHREIDLIEEVMRLNGFDKLNKTLPVMEIKPLRENTFVSFNDQLRMATAAEGYSETMSFPFISNDDLDKFLIPSQHPMRQPVKLRNAIVAEENLLQPSIVFGLLKALERNKRQGENAVKLFECARSYYTPGTSASGLTYFKALEDKRVVLSEKASSERRVIEWPALAGIIGQPFVIKSWDGVEVQADFFHAKAHVQSILASCGIGSLSFSTEHVDELPFLHPGASAVIKKEDKILGFVGELHPKVAVSFGFDMNALPVVFELRIESLLKAKESATSIDTTQFKFPPSTRDLALIVPEGVEYKDFSKALSSFRKRNLKSFHMFDLYKGENVKDGFKSMGFSFSFQSEKRTLNDKDVDKEVDLLLGHLKSEISAELR